MPGAGTGCRFSAEAERYGDTRESEFVRRLYYYAVAATGLLLLWIGLVDLVRALLDLAIIGGASVEEGFRAHQFCQRRQPHRRGRAGLGAALAHRSARGREKTMRAARAERASWPRRVYLYAIALIGALLILFELAQVVYRLLLWALGDPNADVFRRRDLGRPRARSRCGQPSGRSISSPSANDTRMVDEKGRRGGARS